MVRGFGKGLNQRTLPLCGHDALLFFEPQYKCNSGYVIDTRNLLPAADNVETL